MNCTNYKILTLFQKCKALKWTNKGFVIGSCNSHYSTSSYVMALHPRYPCNEPNLAKVEYFCKIDIQLTSNHSLNDMVSYWFAAVSFF